MLRKQWFLATILLLSSAYFLYKTWQRMKEEQLMSEDVEEQRLMLSRNILWLSDPPETITGCRNTKQGPIFVADDQGYLCEKSNTVEGCCPQTSQRFQCSACDLRTSCCSSHFDCVSCCMDPLKKDLLETVIQKASRSRLRLISGSKDQFSLCLLKCRTSSNSVVQENRYKNRLHKYCYGLEPKLPWR